MAQNCKSTLSCREHACDANRFSKLYYGTNQAKQKVLTWYVDEPTEKFDGDLYPLVEEILSMDNANYPTSSYYIGYMSWGTEAYSANTTVTFDVPSLSINVEKKA